MRIKEFLAIVKDYGKKNTKVEIKFPTYSITGYMSDLEYLRQLEAINDYVQVRSMVERKGGLIIYVS